MTLHAAIEQILKENHRPMTSRELTDAINAKHLYERKDKKPIPTSQITARVHQYPAVLRKEGDLITLVNW